jgi:hypothetical protein
MLRSILEYKDVVNILDIGGRRDYWQLLDGALVPQVRVTLANLEDELDVGRRENDPLDVTYLVADACHMPQFADRGFDLAHSNSVIEHVGSLSNMARFADETRRVANAYYVQTPYLWFPVEPHFGVPFLHWLPGPTRARLISRYRIGYAPRMADYRAALDRVDHIEIVDATLMTRLFPDGTLRRERFALMTKSLIAARDYRPA